MHGNLTGPTDKSPAGSAYAEISGRTNEVLAAVRGVLRESAADVVK